MDLTYLRQVAAFVLAMATTDIASAADHDPLRFPAEAYTLQTRQVNAGKVVHTVRYRAWRRIPYVGHPVSAQRQRLDLDMPIAIDGRTVDARQAPIVMNIDVPGDETAHSSSRNTVEEAQLRADLALAAGYVVVTPRLEFASLNAALAAIVDLKAAVRYLHHNAMQIPGNVDWVISAGCSTAGDLSALLGASGDQPEFLPDLRRIGAAESSDKVFASACFSPLGDPVYAGMAHEWVFGTIPADSEYGGSAAFTAYEQHLALRGRDGFGALTGGTLADYLLQQYLEPAATRYLIQMDGAQRKRYLQSNPWVQWEGLAAHFSFDDFARHVGLSAARSSVGYSVQPSFGQNPVDLTNPLGFLIRNHPVPTRNWLFRAGTSDSVVFPVVLVNLATLLENQGNDVSAALSWNKTQCADDDPAGMVAWIAGLTGYPTRPLDRLPAD